MSVSRYSWTEGPLLPRVVPTTAPAPFMREVAPSPVWLVNPMPSHEGWGVVTTPVTLMDSSALTVHPTYTGAALVWMVTSKASLVYGRASPRKGTCNAASAQANAAAIAAAAYVVTHGRVFVAFDELLMVRSTSFDAGIAQALKRCGGRPFGLPCAKPQ